MALAYRGDPGAGGARPQRSVAVALIGLALFVPIALRLKAGDPKQAAAYAAEINGKSLTIGKKDVIVYSGTATEADAKRLAGVLTTVGFLRDHGAMVLYSRAQDGSAISLMVKEEAWKDPKLTAQFMVLGTMISGTTGVPLKLQLLSKEREVKKEFVFK